MSTLWQVWVTNHQRTPLLHQTKQSLPPPFLKNSTASPPPSFSSSISFALFFSSSGHERRRRSAKVEAHGGWAMAGVKDSLLHSSFSSFHVYQFLTPCVPFRNPASPCGFRRPQVQSWQETPVTNSGESLFIRFHSFLFRFCVSYGRGRNWGSSFELINHLMNILSFELGCPKWLFEALLRFCWVFVKP